MRYPNPTLVPAWPPHKNPTWLLIVLCVMVVTGQESGGRGFSWPGGLGPGGKGPVQVRPARRHKSG